MGGNRKLIDTTEKVHYDGSYCPQCISEDVEVFDSSHDFGWLELRVRCNNCNCEYCSYLEVENNLLVRNQVEILEKGVVKVE
jgi:transcriptional regulator NrdR family protein